jgi:hypothetical protein
MLSNTADKISKLAQTQSISEKLMFLRQTTKAMEMSKYLALLRARGGAVVKAKRYKPKGRGIDSLRCHWHFSLT